MARPATVMIAAAIAAVSFWVATQAQTINNLPAGSTPAGTETAPAWQSASTVKLTLNQIFGTGLSQTNNWSAAQNFAETGTYTTGAFHTFTTSLLNGISPASEFNAEHTGSFATEALSVGAAVPGGATNLQVNGLSSYMTTSRVPSGGGGDVAGYFQIRGLVNGFNAFPLNPVCADTVSVHGTCQVEFDYNIGNSSTVVSGLNLFLSGTAQPAATGFACNVLGTTLQWGTCLYTGDGESFMGANFGGNSYATHDVTSQAVGFRGIDTVGNGSVERTTLIYADKFGDFDVRLGLNAGATSGTGQCFTVIDANNGGSPFNDFVACSAGAIVYATTQSTTTANGALTVDGGLGVVKNINAGGTITGASIITAPVIRPGLVVFAGLAAADPSPQVGDQLVISDASACTANTAVAAGGGTTHSCPTAYNGTDWVALVSH